MAALSRKGDINQAGGRIIRGSPTVFANGIPVGLHVSQITPHAPWGRPHPRHHAARTTSASPSVYADGVQVLRVGSGNSCGHSIIQGSPDIEVP